MDATSPLILVVALLLGLEHAFDPDHVIALANIVCNVKNVRKSLVLGSIWSLGHTITVVIVGILVIVLRVAIPQNVTQVFEIAAGILLIVLGLYVLRDLLHERHQFSVEPNSNSASHAAIEDHGRHYHEHKSLFSGALQGLGGSAAIMLVTLSTVNSTIMGLIFIAIFCVGVTAGMVSFGAIIGGVLKYTVTNIGKIHRIIMVITACLGIGLGVFITITAFLFGSAVL